MNNLSVTKSNYLIDASYKLNAQAQKLVLACLSKVDPRADIPKEISITAQEYSELTGINIKNAHRELYKASDALWKAEITLLNGNERIEIRWIQKRISKIKGEGKITLTWSEDVVKYICQLKSRFTTYKLRHIAELQSAHSIRLYELLMKFNSTGERVIYLDDFKSALGIADKYPQFKELNKFVIKKAVEELNQRSDLIIKYETIKKGRAVVALGFEFKQNKQMKLDV
ncbi:RepB family plasmid replication initiator protein [Parashewanella curva]|uniref:RepB family plasmid replication initiator protein n=1 Tax=Parashewanella curva TaxID=2338552 RepID=A0A3L8PTE5_9GAMM|nr:replication initiation protein [Parashewanella curva]RLV57883.1 RepB family plasmid replication initiator protein [Parashewanella curva]